MDVWGCDVLELSKPWMVLRLVMSICKRLRGIHYLRSESGSWGWNAFTVICTRLHDINYFFIAIRMNRNRRFLQMMAETFSILAATTIRNSLVAMPMSVSATIACSYLTYCPECDYDLRSLTFQLPDLLCPHLLVDEAYHKIACSQSNSLSFPKQAIPPSSSDVFVQATTSMVEGLTIQSLLIRTFCFYI